MDEILRVRLEGALQRLLLLLQYRSERNYPAGIAAVECLLAEYREGQQYG